MKIGIFSGTFDPIHIGHIILASYITEFTDIDEVWFLVSPQNPFKVNVGLTDEKIRLQMVTMALESYDKLHGSDYEFYLPRPSYTIDTLNALQTAYPKYEFTLIIGADNWMNFENWKNPEEIVAGYNIMVYPRLGSRISIPSKMRNKVEALESPIVEISSSFIRESISEGRNMQAFLPVEVHKYIMETGLYGSN